MEENKPAVFSRLPKNGEVVNGLRPGYEYEYKVKRIRKLAMYQSLYFKKLYVEIFNFRFQYCRNSLRKKREFSRANASIIMKLVKQPVSIQR